MVVLCFLRRTEGLGSGISALQLNQSVVFGKPTSSLNTPADQRGNSDTLHQTQSPRKGITAFGLASFQGALPSWWHTRELMAVTDCTCPPPALSSNHICPARVSALSLHQSVKQTKEREVREEKNRAMWGKSASQSHKISSWGKPGTILPLISKINRFSHFRYYSSICGFKKKYKKSTCSWAIRSTVSL